MLRPLCLLPLITALAACTGFGTARPYVPKSPPEMRTAAASIMGRDINNSVPLDPANPAPHVDLKPSPGRAPMIGQLGTEVLRSASKSGYYVAFTGQVPVTQYFEIVRRADCDDWVYLQLINPTMVRSNPNYYISGQYIGDKAALKCAGEFHKKFRDGKDERLVGTDGVVFDADSAVYTDVDGGANGHKKLHMDGWAVKFVEPTDEAIRKRLASRPSTPIDVVQLKTVAFWIEKNHARQYAKDLRRLLPMANKRDALIAWHGADREVFRALASIDDLNESSDLYLQILDAGIAEMLRPGNLTTVASPTVGDVPFVAANVLVCRNQPGTISELRKVLLEATIVQHKLASAKALFALGDIQFLQDQLRAGRLGDVSNKVQHMLQGRDIEPFSCPYRSKASA